MQESQFFLYFYVHFSFRKTFAKYLFDYCAIFKKSNS
jgi:hypothetical protein